MSFLFGKSTPKPKPIKNVLDAKDPLKNIHKKMKQYLEKCEAFAKAEEDLSSALLQYQEDGEYGFAVQCFGTSLGQIADIRKKYCAKVKKDFHAPTKNFLKIFDDAEKTRDKFTKSSQTVETAKKDALDLQKKMQENPAFVPKYQSCQASLQQAQDMKNLHFSELEFAVKTLEYKKNTGHAHAVVTLLKETRDHISSIDSISRQGLTAQMKDLTDLIVKTQPIVPQKKQVTFNEFSTEEWVTVPEAAQLPSASNSATKGGKKPLPTAPVDFFAQQPAKKKNNVTKVIFEAQATQDARPTSSDDLIFQKGDDIQVLSNKGAENGGVWYGRKKASGEEGFFHSSLVSKLIGGTGINGGPQKEMSIDDLIKTGMFNA